ncbi:MAG: L,D-transpeptidase family protein [Gammaproteobacteria bacterium]
MLNAIEKIRNNDLDAALSDLEHLVKLNPEFNLAQLMYADMLNARARPITDFGNIFNAPFQQISALREEAKARWRYHQASPNIRDIPVSLVQLADKQKHAIVVDLSISRLFLFQNHNGVPYLIKDFYVTIGKNGTGKYSEGDQKTPVGVYFVTGFIDPKELPDMYGDGAFPINYPNVWDKRYGRTGYGIWLHGTPSGTYSRPPRDSDGCVILSNQDLNTISPFIDKGQTPVILADSIEWIAVDEWKRQRSQYITFIEQWRKDWESRDADLYLRHYSREYSGLGKDYKGWVQYKRRVNPSKNFIQVNINDPSMFLSPGKERILVVTFDQDYKSNNFSRQFKKRQYWRREEDGKWRIIYEGSVS